MASARTVQPAATSPSPTRPYAAVVGPLVLFLFLGAIVALTVLGLRWARPPAGGSDLKRADDVQSAERADARTVRERVFAYVTMYGPKR